MASVWGELKRRNVVKVAVAYAIVGWLLIQVVATVLPLFEAPEWIARVFTFFVVLGFPVAVVIAWAYELTPDGIERTSDVPAAESITKSTGRKLELVTVGALVLALVFVVYNYVLVGPEQEAVIAVTDTAAVEPTEEIDAPEVAEETSGVLPNSVAVLLCDNLSPNPDDAYFAASIHEEILNQLVKISSMNVIARTSVLQYAENPLPIPDVARELNVGAVMECSVRFAGTAIMVTAQLIDPETNSHLWSDTYPGDLSDLSAIFAMQADIATKIANALDAELSLEEQASIEKIPTEFPAAYALYLKAIASFALGHDSWQSEIDQALAIDPDFALAHAANAYQNAFLFGFESWSEELEERVLESSERALSLDPTLGSAYVAIAYVHQVNWRLKEAKQALVRALELDPNDPVILNAYARFQRNVGEYRDSARLGQRAMALDPNNDLFIYQQGINLRYARDYDDAYEALQIALSFKPAASNVHMQIAFTEIARGNREEALRKLDIAEQLYVETNLGRYRTPQFAFGYSQLDRHDDVMRMFDRLTEIDQSDPIDDAIWAMMYLALGDHEQALLHLEQAIDEQDPNIFTLSELKANAYQMPVLDEPRFRRLLDQIGVFE